MFNRSEIMRRAWEIYRTVFRLSQTKAAFRLALQDAWSEAKRAIAAAKRAAEESPRVQRIRDAILSLECKDRWTQADYAERDRLAAELREAA